MHKRSRSSIDKEKSNDDNLPKYQLYNYDSLEWSWAHITILITLGLRKYFKIFNILYYYYYYFYIKNSFLLQL